MSLIRLSLALTALLLTSSVMAQRQTQTEVSAVQERTSQAASSANATTGLNATDLVVAQIWGLTQEEMQRAKLLLKGPRASFSVEQLSPVEALGIHARTDAERRKYAEMFARAFHQDVERSIAWNAAFQEAMQRLYPNEAMVDYRGLPKVVAPIGSADAAGVPRSVVADPAPSARPLPARR